MLYKRGGRDRSSYVGRRQSDGGRIGKVRRGESKEKHHQIALRIHDYKYTVDTCLGRAGFALKKIASKRKETKQDPFRSFSSAPAKKIDSFIHFFSPNLHQIFHSASVFICFKAKHKTPFFASKEKIVNFASYFSFHFQLLFITTFFFTFLFQNEKKIVLAKEKNRLILHYIFRFSSKQVFCIILLHNFCNI